MKRLNLGAIILVYLVLTLNTSCSTINEIYTSGMGYGIFTALAIIVIIAFVGIKLKKK